MKWWSIVPRATCIFALDSEAKTDKDKVYFSNSPLKSLTYLLGKNKAIAGSTSGYNLTNLKYPEPLVFETYKALRIESTALLFGTPITLPEEFTFILKVRVKSSTSFLSNNGLQSGLIFGTGELSRSDDKLWRISGYNTASDYTPAVIKNAPMNQIHTIVLKGNLSTKNSSFLTNYGKYNILPDSLAYLGQGFLVNRSYTTIGDVHTTATWGVNADIIAYGLFDKEFTDLEVSSVLSQVNAQFKGEDIFLSCSPESGYTPFDLSTGSSVRLEPLIKKLFLELSIPRPLLGSVLEPYITTLTTKVSESLELKAQLKVDKTFRDSGVSILYKNLKDIEDQVLEEGLPVQTTLYLYERESGELLKTTNSNLEGMFNFLDLDIKSEYIVTAKDPKYQFKSIIKDYNL